jgi:hypothetical protein
MTGSALAMDQADRIKSEASARMRGTVEGNGSQQQQHRRLPERSGSGWDDAWDSSSDPEDNGNLKSGRHGSANRSNARSGLGDTNTTPIAVPVSKKPVETPALAMGSEDSNDRDTPPIRSNSYAHISPPSPSSYGPRTDWTVLERTEITEAEKVYEAQSNARLRQAASSGPIGAPLTSNNSSPSASAVKVGTNTGSSRSFSSGVAGLSKSFMNIALGAPHAASSSARNPSGKGKGKEVAASPVDQASCTPSRKQVHGRDAIRSDIDEILRGKFTARASTVQTAHPDLSYRPAAHSQRMGLSVSERV